MDIENLTLAYVNSCHVSELKDLLEHPGRHIECSRFETAGAHAALEAVAEALGLNKTAAKFAREADYITRYERLLDVFREVAPIAAMDKPSLLNDLAHAALKALDKELRKVST